MEAAELLAIALCGCLARISWWYERGVSETLAAVLLAAGGTSEASPTTELTSSARIVAKSTALVHGALLPQGEGHQLFSPLLQAGAQHALREWAVAAPVHWTCSARYRNYSYPKLIARMLSVAAGAGAPVQEISLPCTFWPGDDVAVYEAVAQWVPAARSPGDRFAFAGLKTLALPLCSATGRRQAQVPHPSVVCELIPRLLQQHGPTSLRTLVVPPIQTEARSAPRDRRRVRSEPGDHSDADATNDAVDQVGPITQALHHCRVLEVLVFCDPHPLPFRRWADAPFSRTLHTLVISPEGGTGVTMDRLADAMPNLRNLVLLPALQLSAATAQRDGRQEDAEVEDSKAAGGWTKGLGRLLYQLESFRMVDGWCDDDEWWDEEEAVAGWTDASPIDGICRLQTLEACPMIFVQFAPRLTASLHTLVVALSPDTWRALQPCAQLRCLKLYEPDDGTEYFYHTAVNTELPSSAVFFGGDC
jgi:hypothetical protein